MEPLLGDYVMLSRFTFMHKIKQLLSIFKNSINAITNQDIEKILDKNDEEYEKKKAKMIFDNSEKMRKLIPKFCRILFYQMVNILPKEYQPIFTFLLGVLSQINGSREPMAVLNEVRYFLYGES